VNMAEATLMAAVGKREQEEGAGGGGGRRRREGAGPVEVAMDVTTAMA
jgi:hypothetical protein